MKKSEAACKKIRAASTESQVIAAVREYVGSLGAPEVAGLPVNVLSSCLVQTEEAVHSALQLVEDALGSVGVGKPDPGAADEMRLVLTTAARRLAAIGAKTR